MVSSSWLVETTTHSWMCSTPIHNPLSPTHHASPNGFWCPPAVSLVLRLNYLPCAELTDPQDCGWRHDAQTTPRSKTGVLSVTRRANLRGPLIRADELSITRASRTAASCTQTCVASKAPRRPYITGPSTVAPQHSDNADCGLEVFRDGARPSYL